MDDKVVIVSAVRTPIGKFCGSLSGLASYELGAHVIKGVLERGKVDPADVDEVIMGQVLTAGQGMNPARHATILAGLPESCPACIVNQVCGSGLRAVVMATQAIHCHDSNIVVAGGMESMSQSPHCINIRSAVRFGDKQLEDVMMKDGLTDCFHGYSMGVTAENVAKKYNLTRAEQDEFACKSQLLISKHHGLLEVTLVGVVGVDVGGSPQKQNLFHMDCWLIRTRTRPAKSSTIPTNTKAKVAENLNALKAEILPVPSKVSKDSVLLSQDEHPRSDTTIEKLSRLRPAFLTEDDKNNGYHGTVTAGNSSGLNDGAAALLVMSQTEAIKRGLSPMATIVGWAHVGVNPAVMGLGPIPAIRKALEKCSWDIHSVDLFEINEAFAAQSVAVVKELGIAKDKVNVNGGALALGHPLGASGARIVVTLLHAMSARSVKRGVAALCVGGGMGIAMCFERL